MSVKTLWYQLVKPARSEAPDITAIDGNWDLLDTELRRLAVAAAAVPSLATLDARYQASSAGAGVLTTAVFASTWTLSGGVFTTAPVAPTDPVADPGWSGGIYTVPAGKGGLYEVSGRLRCTDSVGTEQQFGMGIHTSNGDGTWFEWHIKPAASTDAPSSRAARYTGSYKRTMQLAAGAQVRLYAWVPTAGAPTFQGGEMTVRRIL